MKKFKKFAKSRWHSIPLGAIALALVASVALTGLAYAAVSISNTWISPSVVVTVKPLIPVPLVISSDLDGGGTLAKYTGDEIPLTITIKNNGPVGYTGIQTHTSIYRTDGTPIAEGDVRVWHCTPGGTWQELTEILDWVDNNTYGKALLLTTNTAPITELRGSHDTDITPLKVIFNTAGTYQASAYSEN
jgi:hypothetical protein